MRNAKPQTSGTPSPAEAPVVEEKAEVSKEIATDEGRRVEPIEVGGGTKMYLN